MSVFEDIKSGKYDANVPGDQRDAIWRAVMCGDMCGEAFKQAANGKEPSPPEFKTGGTLGSTHQCMVVKYDSSPLAIVLLNPKYYDDPEKRKNLPTSIKVDIPGSGPQDVPIEYEMKCTDLTLQ